MTPQTPDAPIGEHKDAMVQWRVTGESVDSKPRNPRKKTLEQRLDEAMSFVSEAQLNEEVAAKVKALVLMRYADQSGVSCFKFGVSDVN